jgi:hypothetical protein
MKTHTYITSVSKYQGKGSIGRLTRREIILKCISGYKDVGGFIWLRIGYSGYCCENGNEDWDSIKRGGVTS